MTTSSFSPIAFIAMFCDSIVLWYFPLVDAFSDYNPKTFPKRNCAHQTRNAADRGENVHHQHFLHVKSVRSTRPVPAALNTDGICSA